MPIPQPPESFLIGNLFEIDGGSPLASFERLINSYGPIFRLNLAGTRVLVITSHELVTELCNERIFEKKVGVALTELRTLVGNGLFTADNSDPEWKLAHRILMPAFGPAKIQQMFPDMLDIASQLVNKWERFGTDYIIDVPNDFTRVTLDTIALCSFSHRFNSFYAREMNPFVDAMVDTLLEAGRRPKRLTIQQTFMFAANKKYFDDIKFIHEMCDKIVQQRKENPVDRADLLNAMLMKDKETGRGLSDDNIRAQMVTFLIAGHETTSGMLSFTLYYLLKDPTKFQKAQEEVDRVTGGGPLTLQHLKQLPYLDACMKESLRLSPTAPAFQVGTLNGPHTFKTGHTIQPTESAYVILPKLHRDPKVWGDDAEEFRPERMLDGGFERLPQNAWKPFGNGMRGCIGRAFAWQESLLVLALIIQRFNFEMVDPAYELRIKQTLTIKPADFFVKAKPRKVNSSPLSTPFASPARSAYPSPSRAGRSTPPSASSVAPTPGNYPTPGGRQLLTPKNSDPDNTSSRTNVPDLDFAAEEPANRPIAIFFGTNAGSCESFADQIAANASIRGFQPSISTLDSATEHIPINCPVIFISPSYEGQPPDNGKRFVTWLESLSEESALKDVSYAVLGAGHRDWVETFQRVPTQIDAKLEKCGAKRLVPRGAVDAAGDFFGDFETWEDTLWPALGDYYGMEPDTWDGAFDESLASQSLQIEITTEKRAAISGLKDYGAGLLKENRLLTPEKLKNGGAQRRHLEIELPQGMTYRAGDYLALLPVNPADVVKRVMRRFELTDDSCVHIRSLAKTFLPTDRPIHAASVLAGYVELSEPTSRRTIEILLQAASHASSADTLTKDLERYNDPGVYEAEILGRRVSLLDLLERHPQLPLPFNQFLSLLPPMRMRQYSISSSPLWNPHVVTITFDVLNKPALSGQSNKIGVASNYLAHLTPGSRIGCVVKPCSANFHLPADPKTPIVMVAAGSGISPMRGFLQERARMMECGREVGKAIFYYGCRDPEEFGYRGELEKWEALGAVSVRHVYSRHPNSTADTTAPNSTPLQQQFKYVDERMWEDRDEIARLYLKEDARIYVCGSADKLAKSAADVCVRIYMDTQNVSRQEALEWFEKQKGVRYATDVFG
ncbi:bifunctional P-450:NADPH-P450 reductase [Powellomyces hirtus]|nr:bifunctional P-450:NADPH-P450 reductase [Powellomyces hirtus]